MATLASKGEILAGYLFAAFIAYSRSLGAEVLWLSDALRILDPCACGALARSQCRPDRCGRDFGAA